MSIDFLVVPERCDGFDRAIAQKYVFTPRATMEPPRHKDTKEIYST
jgi:hypothetical protein